MMSFLFTIGYSVKGHRRAHRGVEGSFTLSPSLPLPRKIFPGGWECLTKNARNVKHLFDCFHPSTLCPQRKNPVHAPRWRRDILKKIKK